MRFLRITFAYSGYVAQFYGAQPGIATASHAEQQVRFDHDHFAWGNSLSTALATLGYETLEIDAGMTPLVQAWARENLGTSRIWTVEEVVLERVRRFQPEILLFDCPHHALLRAIRAAHPGLRLVLGWTGSAIGLADIWRDMDVVLSCAPESVEEMRRRGYRAEHLDHAFDAAVTTRLRDDGSEIPVSFIGSIIRRDSFHVERERILLALAERIPLRIYSPAPPTSARDYAKIVVCGGLQALSVILAATGLREAMKRRSHFMTRVLALASVPRLPVNRQLARLARPGIFGLAYYQAMRSSLVSLNIHADSSPRFASNIRLFESPGVGSCLLTDWRPNLPKLFEPDREVVAYRTAAECAEKALWLLDHPRERAEIARRGQERVIREHNFQNRAISLDALIRRLV